MAKAESGDTVRVHYTGKLSDGQVFDSSQDEEPLQFTLGEGEVIPGFEDAVLGLEPGDSVTAEVPAGEAYGKHRDEMEAVVERDKFPEDLDLEVGQQLEIETEDGGNMVVRVSALSDSEVKLDANHPLAGEDLVFDIELLEIV